MDTECFIKSFMLIAIILLMLSCLQTTEKFTPIDFSQFKINKSIAMNVTLENDIYYFVSFDQLNNDYRNKIIEILSNDPNFMDPRENINDVKQGLFYKTPIFLVNATQINIMTNTAKLNFLLTSESGAYALTPQIAGITIADKYLFFNKDLGLLYYAKDGPNSDIIHINKNWFIKPFRTNKLAPYSDMNLMSITLVNDNESKLDINISQ